MKQPSVNDQKQRIELPKWIYGLPDNLLSYDDRRDRALPVYTGNVSALSAKPQNSVDAGHLPYFIGVTGLGVASVAVSAATIAVLPWLFAGQWLLVGATAALAALFHLRKKHDKSNRWATVIDNKIIQDDYTATEQDAYRKLGGYIRKKLRESAVCSEEIKIHICKEAAVDVAAIGGDQQIIHLVLSESFLPLVKREEFDAILNHEVSHYHHRFVNRLRSVQHTGQTLVLSGALVALASANLPLFAGLMGAYIGAVFLKKQAKQIDEYRADRAAILKAKSAKIFKTMLDKAQIHTTQKHKIVAKQNLLNFSTNLIFAEHPPHIMRKYHADRLAQKHGLEF